MENPLPLWHFAQDHTLELCVLTPWHRAAVHSEKCGIQQEICRQRDQGAVLGSRQLSQAAQLLQSPSELPGCSLHPGLSRSVKSLLPQLSWKSLHAQLQSVCQLLCIFRAWDHLASAVRSKQAESSSSLKDLVG